MEKKGRPFLISSIFQRAHSYDLEPVGASFFLAEGFWNGLSEHVVSHPQVPIAPIDKHGNQDDYSDTK